MRRTAALAAALTALLTIVLGACGSESSTTTGPASSTPTSSTAPDDSATSSTTSSTTTPPTTTATTVSDPTTPTTADVSDAPDVVPDSYRLPLDQPVAVGGGVTLRLVELEDSRCPEGVMCVWAGELTARVAWTSDGVDTTLDLTWAYVADPTQVPGTGVVLALDDATADGATVTIRPA